MTKRMLSLFWIIAVGLLACTSSASAQTTQLNQTAAGANCHVTGCINVPVGPNSELLTFSDTLQYYGSYNIAGKFLFRGMHYQATGKSSGYQLIDLSICKDVGANCVAIPSSFALHEDFKVTCFRSCSNSWLNGYFDVPNQYVTSDPAFYGNGGSLSGNGQVGFAVTAPTSAVVVSLSTDNPNVIQVPAQVTVAAGSLFADFAITTTVPDTGIGPLYTVTITATFPDGTTATFPVTVQNLPPPPPPDSMLRPFYPCGSKQFPCPGTLAAEHKLGTCWWDGKGADWYNIRCFYDVPKGYWIAEAVTTLER